MIFRFTLGALLILPVVCGVTIQLALMASSATFFQYFCVIVFVALLVYGVGLWCGLDGWWAFGGPGFGYLAGAFLPAGFVFSIMGGVLWALSAFVSVHGFFRIYGVAFVRHRSLRS
ncbi:MAG: hypothetical protein Q7R54_02570 [bacterium]|nr:hypothetical protein [bacterium]